MRQKHGFIVTIFIVLLLMQSENGITDTSTSSASLEPETASGDLTVNEQTFYIKHAYAKKTNQQDETKQTTFLIVLTNRPFREDLSKLDRFDLNRFAERHDIHGIVAGIDENQRLLFTDILRVATITGTAEFKPSANKSGLIEGRIYTKGKKHFFKDRFEFDITFSTKP